MSGRKRKIDQVDEVIQLNDNVNLNIDSKFLKNIYHIHLAGQVSIPHGPLIHPNNPQLQVRPDLVRNDGTVIFVEVLIGDKKLKEVREDNMQLVYEIPGVTDCHLVTVKLTDHGYNQILKFIYPMGIRQSRNYVRDIFCRNIPRNQRPMSTTSLNQLNQLNPSTSLEPPKKMQKINSNERPRSDFIAASKLRNFMMGDPLIDWLESNRGKANETATEIGSSTPYKGGNSYHHGNGKPPVPAFLEHIFEKGHEFEAHVIKMIREFFGEEKVRMICSDPLNVYERMDEYRHATLEAMKEGIPFIYQGVLINVNHDLFEDSFGLPDLIVRSDYLNELVSLPAISGPKSKIQSPVLKTQYHYVIVDIKFTTLHLCSDGIRLLNSGSIPAFKAQLYVYNHALGQLQGYEPPEAYILGHKWKYQERDNCYAGTDCFDRLGIIQYNAWDKDYIQRTADAVKWMKEVRSDGKNWNLLPSPSREELYPNMSTTNETVWNGFKEDYAKHIAEITLIWQCGLKQRHAAHSKGVYRWDDPDCSAELMGIKGPKIAPLVDGIISINQKTDFSNPYEMISIIPAKSIPWKERPKLEFYVDFETINDVFDNFEIFPKASGAQYIFMIGVGWINNETGKFEFDCFIADKLNPQSELEMMIEFFNHVRSVTDRVLGAGSKIPPLYHWSNAENAFFNSSCDKLLNIFRSDEKIKAIISEIYSQLDWTDLLKIFKENQAVVKGAFGFGLKEVAPAMHAAGLIQSNWDKNNPCHNGNDAMVLAHKVYQRNPTDIISDPTMKNVAQYNAIDCAVLAEIITVMRRKVSLILPNTAN